MGMGSKWWALRMAERGSLFFLSRVLEDIAFKQWFFETLLRSKNYIHTQSNTHDSSIQLLVIVGFVARVGFWNHFSIEHRCGKAKGSEAPQCDIYPHR
jgi:hypothetical protein